MKLTAVLLLLFATPLYGQATDGATAAQNGARSAGAQLNQTRTTMLAELGDLLATAEHLNATEQRIATSITGAAQMSLAQINAAAVLLNIYANMESASDARTVAGALVTQLRLCDRVMNEEIGDEDGYMALSSSPAVVREATALRDQMRAAANVIGPILAALNLASASPRL